METLLAMILAPFLLVAMLLLARPIKWLIFHSMKEGDFRHMLFKPRSNQSTGLNKAEGWIGKKAKALLPSIGSKQSS